MLTERRILDIQAIEAAEFARKNNRVILAAEMAAIGLGLTSSPLSFEEVVQIASDPDQRLVLACLARIHVDSLKTAANQAKSPPQTLWPLEKACWTVNTIYRNPALMESLKDVETDYLGRQHCFGPEMKRDAAKVLFAASVLYGHSKSDELIILGEGILLETYNSLPNGHSTKPLIGIEMQISRALRGQRPNTTALRRDFEALRESDEKTNPHRAATVASWLVVWGERLRDEETRRAGFEVFDRLTREHPEWAFMTEIERKKITKQQFRRVLFKLLTPLSTSSQRRRNLYSCLKEEGNIG